MQALTRFTRNLVAATVLVAVWSSGWVAFAQKAKTAVPADPDDRVIAHVLNRLAFGAVPGDFERLRQLGLTTYIEQQLHPERLANDAMSARLAGLQTITKSTRELASLYFLPAQMARQQQQRRRAAQPAQDPSMNGQDPSRNEMASPEMLEAARGERLVLVELSQQKILRAAYSERQLEEVMVDFWFNHFNVFAGKGQTRLYVTEYERDAIRPHVFGKFRDLLQATAESPAMLFYLDNWQSSAPPDARTMTGDARRPQRGRARARQPGSFDQPRTLADMPPGAQNRRPRGLNENYARELMELHTLGVDGGYSQKDVQEVARAFTGWTIANPRQGGAFTFEGRLHDDGEKLVLGQKIKAGGGRKDGEQVLDLLAAHPSTARHIATKLARRFVSDNPPAALVERAARRFKETNGDIREVVRTIVTSPEFFAPAAYRAKIKSPFEFVVSAVRATRADTLNAVPIVQSLRGLGMPLYMCQPPTGYPDKAEAWVNTGALLNRMNFAVALTTGRMRGARGSASLPPNAAVVSSNTVVSAVMAGDVSDSTSATAAKATTPAQAVALVLGSPDFQKR
jgi:uncharacterized protein (DUF1800 family)